MNKFTVNLIVAISVISIGLVSALAFSNAYADKQFNTAQAYQVDALGNVATNQE